MADAEYAKKLESLQQYIPFLENMIAQLKDPKKKNREQQVNKMESLYAMIIDKKKKWKLETLNKCEDVLKKLYSKVKPSDKPHPMHEPHKYVCRDPPEFLKEKTREHRMRLEAARARLQEVATPASPSPPRELFPARPIVIPTEKVQTRSPAAVVADELLWDKPQKLQRPDVYGSAAESLILASRPTGPKVDLPDMSKPPISLEDLRLLQDDAPASAMSETERLSLLELEGLREQIQRELVGGKKAPPPDKEVKQAKKEVVKVAKVGSGDSGSDTSACSKPPRVEKVLKEPDSIFGNLLSSLDEKLLEGSASKTKKDKKKDDKKEHKKSSSGKKNEDDPKKKTHDSSHKKSSSSKDRKSSDKHRDKDKTKHKSSSKESKKPETTDATKDANAEPVYKRLADKYNPKPRKPSLDATDTKKTVVPEVTDIDEPKLTHVEPRPPTPPKHPPCGSKLQPKVLDPRLKQQPILDALKQPNIIDNVLHQLRGTMPILNVNTTCGGMTPHDPFLSSPPGAAPQFGKQQLMPQNQLGPYMQPQFQPQPQFPGPDPYAHQNRNTYVNTFIMQNNNMHQNQFNPVYHNFPQTTKAFNPYEPIAPTRDEYDLSKMQPVDFLPNPQQQQLQQQQQQQAAATKPPMFSPPFTPRFDRPTYWDKPRDPRQGARSNEFGDVDERVQPTKREQRARYKDRQHAREDYHRDRSRYDAAYSRLDKSRGEKEEAFVSPLDSLYASGSRQVGKGYGVQRFRIPKIKKEDAGESRDGSSEKEDKTEVVVQEVEQQSEKEPKAEVDVPKEVEKPKENENEDQKQPEKEKETVTETKPVDEKPASQSEQSMLGEFIANLIGNTNKKDVLVTLFNTLADSLSSQQKKKFRRIQRIADSDSSEDDEATSKETPKKETEPEVKPHEEPKPEEPPVITEPIVEEPKPATKPKKRGRKSGPKKPKPSEPAEPEIKPETKPDAEPEANVDVVESVGERIKNRKRNKPDPPAPTKSKRPSELDILHADIADMFIRDGVLTATGKRMCRILKDDPAALVTGESKKVTKKDLEAAKRNAKGTNPCVLLEKTDISKLVGQSFTERKSRKELSDTESLTDSSASPKRPVSKRGSLQRSAKTQAKYKEENSDDDQTNRSPQVSESEPEEPPEEEKQQPVEKKKHKKLKSNWALGILKKKPKKRVRSADRSSDISSQASVDDDARDSEPEPAAETPFEEPDLDYYHDPKVKMSCKLCTFKGKMLVQHYKIAHPASEVMISRLPKDVAAKLIREATDNDYDSVVPVDVWEIKNRKKRFPYACPFCSLVMTEKSDVFYDHLSSHTGEFRFHCDKCVFKTANVKSLRAHMHCSHSLTAESLTNLHGMRPPPPNFQYVFGYICSECNYVQVEEKRLEEHVRNIHGGRKARVVKVNLSVRELAVEVPKVVVGEKKTEEEEVPKKVTRASIKAQTPEVKEPTEEKETEDETSAKKPRGVQTQKAIEQPVPIAEDETPDATEPAVVKTETNENKSKEQSALNVFTCETDTTEENQKIEEERKQKMKEINDTIKLTRSTNLASELLTRIVQNQHSDEIVIKTDECEVIDDGGDNTGGVWTPTEIPEEDTPPEEPLPDSKTPPPQVPSKAPPLEAKNNAPIGNTIQRLQGNLTKPLPLMPRGQLATADLKSSGDLVLFRGCFEIRRKDEKLIYSCTMPTCIQTTDDQQVFRKHCKNGHLGARFASTCSLCKEGDETYACMLDFFEHVVERHLEELKTENPEESDGEKSVSPGVPLLRMRRLSGDILSDTPDESVDEPDSSLPFKIVSVTSQADDDNFKFPFAITNVMSLATESEELQVETPVSSSPPPLTLISPTKAAVVAQPAHAFTRLGKSLLRGHPQKVLLKDHPIPSAVVKHPRKDPAALQILLQPRNIVNLYKCPLFACSFSTNSRPEFEGHLRTHPKLEKGLTKCLYCNYCNQLEHISIHIDVRHAKSLFSCGYCLFRAVCQSYVHLHVVECHQELPKRIYKLPVNQASMSVKGGIPRPSIKELFATLLYVCGVENCRKRFLFKNDFEAHLKQTHAFNEVFRCPMCASFEEKMWVLRKTDAVFVHYAQQHMICKYVCRYCKASSNNFGNVYKHLALMHPGLPFDIVVREFMNDGSGARASNYSVDSEDLYERLVHVVQEIKTFLEPSEVIDLSASKVRSVLKLIPEVKMGVSNEPTLSPTISLIKKTAQVAKASTNEPLVLNRFLSETSLFNLRCDESVLQVDTESLPVDTSETARTSFAFNEESLDNDDLVIPDDGKKEGYVARELFRCEKCAGSFENSMTFRFHISKCVDVKTGKPFKCFHCGRVFKANHSLCEHIRMHGTSVYNCSLCDFKHAQLLHLRNHMKVRHKVPAIAITPVDLKKNDIDRDEFIVRPKIKRKTSADASAPQNKETNAKTSEEEPAADQKTTFSPSEIDQLPRQPISSRELKCALCNYSTKVRTNLVRHLEFHSKEKDVPTSAPVNPVPCLDKSEKMFDKMINLAFNSVTTTSRMGAKGDREKIALSKEEEAQLPAYVVATKRYVCGATNCNYLCLEESGLRHHILALHADESAYTCKHCGEILSRPDGSIEVDDVGRHLRLHDSSLFKCGYCKFIHQLKHKVEWHLTEKHLDKNPLVLTVRESSPDSTDPENVEIKETSSKELKPWKCGVCKYRALTRDDIVTHVGNNHDIGEQYKCALCKFVDFTRETFAQHFEERHQGHEVDVIDAFFCDRGSAKSLPFDTTPLWQRDRQRVRHIRGILFDESGKLPKKSPVKLQLEVVTVEESPPPKKRKEEEPKVVVRKAVPKVPVFDKLGATIEAVARGTVDEEVADEVIIVPSVTPVVIKKDKSEKTTDEKIEALNRDISQIMDLLDSPLVDEKPEMDNDDVIIVEDEESKIINLDSDEEEEKSPDVLVENLLSDDVGTFGRFGEPENGQYKCPKCDQFRTTDESVFKTHLYEELKYPRFKCQLCDKTGPDRSFVERHISRVHKLESDDCLMEELAKDNLIELFVYNVLMRQGRLLLEEASAKGDASFASPVRKEQRSEDETVSSSNEETPTKKNKCQYCEYSCKSQSDLRRHEKRHWAQKPLRCGHCDYEGVTRSEISSHSKYRHKDLELSVVHIPMPSTPTIIPISRKRKSGPKGSEVITSSCGEGSQPAAKRCALEDDVNVTDCDSDVAVNEGDVVCVCGGCDKVCVDADEVRKHWEEAHIGEVDYKRMSREEADKIKGSVYDFSDIDIANMEQTRRYKCTICGHTSSNWMLMTTSHIRSHFKPFECAYCDKTYMYPAMVHTHQHKMHPDKPFKYNTIDEELKKRTNFHQFITEVDETGNGGKRKADTPPKSQKLPKKPAVVDENELLVVQKTVYTARKRTAPVKTRPTARKSTSKPTVTDDEYSFYGTKPDECDPKKTVTRISINDVEMQMSVEKVSHIMNLYPRVVAEDCARGSREPLL